MTKKSSLSLVAFLLMFAGIAYASHSYFQGFEIDIFDWNETKTTRVASGGDDGIDSASGSYHANVASGAFTKWAGYNYVFPANGYVTSVDIYLEPGSTTAANDTRFDFSSAVSNTTDGHRRDFVFNAGFYTDLDAGRRFVISASNNAGRSGANPKNPDRSPFSIAEDDWYTFEHVFSNVNGVLSVDLRIKNTAGDVLKTWTLSDPSDLIPSAVGGNRYGWFATQEFSVLAIDNASKFDVRSTPADKEQCKKGGWSQLVNGSNEDFRNQGQCVKFVTTGN